MAAKAKAKASMTQTEMFKQLAEQTGLQKKQVADVVTALTGLIGSELKKSGNVSLFRLIKVKLVDVPAREAGEYFNSFTKQTATRPARPASKKVKVLPLKSLKDLVN